MSMKAILGGKKSSEHAADPSSIEVPSMQTLFATGHVLSPGK